MNFLEALEMMKQGKYVKRASDPAIFKKYSLNNSYRDYEGVICKTSKPLITENNSRLTHFYLEDFEADNWEVV